MSKRVTKQLQRAIDNEESVEIVYTCQTHGKHGRLTRIVDPKEITALRTGPGLYAEEGGKVKSFLLKGIQSVTAVED